MGCDICIKYKQFVKWLIPLVSLVSETNRYFIPTVCLTNKPCHLGVSVDHVMKKISSSVINKNGVLPQNIHLRTTICFVRIVYWVLGQLVYFGGGVLWQTIPQLTVGSGCVCCECDKVQQASQCLCCLSTRRLYSCDASSFNCTSQFIFMTVVSCSKPRSSMQHDLRRRPGKDLHRRICHHVIHCRQINSILV